MADQKKMRFFIILWWFSVFGNSKTDECNRMRNGKLERYCCNNHEDNNGICEECKVGYKSVDGFPCKPCPLGTWGRKCSGNCLMKCTSYQSCDRMIGCINFTEISRDTSSSEIDTTIENQTVQKENKLIKGFLHREIVTYTIGGVSFVIVITVCTFCLCYKEKLHDTFVRFYPHSRDVSGVGIDRIPHDEPHYESVDEDNIPDTPNLLRYVNRHSKSSSETDNIAFLDDGYLEPYQSAAVREYSTTNHLNSQQDKTGNSSGSENESNTLSHADSYSNPYQPITNNTEKHEYESCNQHRDSLERSERIEIESET